MDTRVRELIRSAVGAEPQGLAPLSGGCVAEVYRADLPGGDRVVVKVGRGGDSNLSVEGFMLEYLAQRTALPVPRVISSSDELLVMEHVDASGWSGGDERAERHAAELLAALHGVSAEAYGFERDTLIGGVRQPCPWTGSWAAFFGEHRLVYTARLAAEAGRLDRRTLGRVERLASRLDRWIGAAAPPSLIHGDVWSGNVLARRGRIAALLDPAIYYADPEVELAFITLFNCFGRGFFERYAELRPIRDGFFEERRDLYNLYPLLVHTLLFGGAYAAQAERVLARYEC